MEDVFFVVCYAFTPIFVNQFQSFFYWRLLGNGMEAMKPILRLKMSNKGWIWFIEFHPHSITVCNKTWH